MANNSLYRLDLIDKTVPNGRVANGGVTDSKINITPNPLAGLDASEDSIPKVSVFKRNVLYPHSIQK